MESANVVCTIDELGRVLLPKEIRDVLGCGIGDKITLSPCADVKTVTLRLSDKLPTTQ